MLADEQQHGRHHEDGGDLVAVNVLQRLRRIEAAVQDDVRALEEGGEREHVERAGGDVRGGRRLRDEQRAENAGA